MANRDRKEPHGPSLPHHRAYGSRTRRFGRLSRSAWRQAYHRHHTFQPKPRPLPRQPRFHPSHKACAPGLAGCTTAVPWQASAPLFQSPFGEPFGPSVPGAAVSFIAGAASFDLAVTGVNCTAVEERARPDDTYGRIARVGQGAGFWVKRPPEGLRSGNDVGQLLAGANAKVTPGRCRRPAPCRQLR